MKTIVLTFAPLLPLFALVTGCATAVGDPNDTAAQAPVDTKAQVEATGAINGTCYEACAAGCKCSLETAQAAVACAQCSNHCVIRCRD